MSSAAFARIVIHQIHAHRNADKSTAAHKDSPTVSYCGKAEKSGAIQANNWFRNSCRAFSDRIKSKTQRNRILLYELENRYQTHIAARFAGKLPGSAQGRLPKGLVLPSVSRFTKFRA
jgi:hypothetical protein